ncbi:uncharacterized protein LY89DRAFT_780813 [Mollisia scopiformis]|uniref:CorA-like transporter domain-containing protein n=1 Tax=Mollisia scopiformis TaxID=149040 RepID=A0A194XF98_MOLSC|nr:uncharacterized protein LY89DRAFT_780813 [Mollisia scopiformis]KUJ18809.1 hypothetical protein LY89DRAFT_780813 [Mollisia scopiformis]
MSTDGEFEKVEADWLRYPASLKDFDSIAVDSSACMEQIDRLSDVLFSKGTKVEVLESSISSGFLSRNSIWQANSLSPLRISKSSLLKILTRYEINPQLLDVVCAFGDKQISSDEVSEVGLYNTFDGMSYETSYQLRYVERNERAHGDPWSVRQTGVYHKISGVGTTGLTNMWMLLHPMPNSKAYRRLQESTSEDDAGEAVDADPLRLHLLVFSSYIDNWRLYLHDMTRQFLELEDNLMTSELRDRSEYTMLNFETLQQLRHLAGKLIPIPTILQASIKTLRSIAEMSSTLDLGFQTSPSSNIMLRKSKSSYHLRAFQNRLESYLESCYVLQSRIENMTKFLADGLNLQNQEISAESNGHLVTLTKDTVDDSATVRAITFVTLIYLPATFISGLLGSNLFAFESGTSDFVISHQFWLYFALTIPLTILTVGYWKYRTWKQAKKRAEDAALQHLNFV